MEADTRIVRSTGTRYFANTDLSRSSVADLHLLYFVVFVVLAFTVPPDTFDTLSIASSDVYLRLSDVGQLFSILCKLELN